MKQSFKTTRQIADSIRLAVDRIKWPDNYTIITDSGQLKRVADLIRSEEEFFFDVETSGLVPWSDRVLGMSLWVAGEAFVIPLEHTLLKCVPVGAVKKYLNEAFTDPSVRRINHNIKFDMHFIEQSSGVTVGPAYCDTLLQALVINPDNEQPHGLKELCSQYGLSDSDEGNYTAQFGKTAWSHLDPKLAAYYACKDVDYVVRLRVKQDEILAKSPKLVDLFWNLEMPMLNLTYRMEREGVNVDADYVKKVLTPKVYSEWAKAIEAATPVIEPHLAYAKAETVQQVLDSPTKLERVFFDQLGVPEIKYVTLRYGPMGPFTKRTLDKEAIAALKSTCEPVRLLGEYRKWATIKKMFVDTLPSVVFDGRVHPTFNCIGAATGRMSCQSPNLQQIPSRLGALVRNMFVPKPGNVFMSADFSSQEMRILACYTKDEGLIKFFTDPKALDPYSETAIMVSKDDLSFDEKAFRALSKSERKETAIYRDFKALVLGLGFGMGAAKYARNTGKSKKEGETNYRKYHDAFPGVKRFQEAAAKFARKNGFITTLLGRQRPLYEINNTADAGRRTAAERAAFNTPIQGSAADMAKKAAILCDELIQKNNWPVRIALIVHDEIIFEMPKAWAKKHKAETDLLVSTMETALPLETTDGFLIPMKCSKEFESRWAERVDEDDLDDIDEMVA